MPAGKIFEFTIAQSKIFPGTERTISVYVPAQYDARQPACVYLSFDGFRFAAPVVFDNLIHQQAIPVTIGIGISPGAVPSANPPADPRFNRSFEYDSLNDRMARFILDELLPEVERRQTPGGLPIRLSRNPNDRCVSGASSGAIAAFTLAWEHPEEFRRVFSAIGTYVGMRGGDRYPVLVRKTEPKPIRIFLQDGEHDQWMGGPEVGDWWMSNLTMQRALVFAGYQVRHEWGTGTHHDAHPAALFPNAIRWLWQDWPAPVQAGRSQNLFLNAMLAPSEDWQAVEGIGPASALTSDLQGNVLFNSSENPNTWQAIDSAGQVDRSQTIVAKGGTIAVGPDGRIYMMDPASGTLAVRDQNGKVTEIARNLRGEHMVVTHSGNIYVTESDKVWLVRANGEATVVDTGLDAASGVVLSPNGLWLAVAEEKTHWGVSYRVEADGTLTMKQRFYRFEVPDWAECSGARGWSADREGRFYSATLMGVQVFDRNGRVRAILPAPGGPVTSLCFGGTDFNTLYIASGGKVYRRKLKAKGAPAWLPPFELPPWGIG